MKCPSCQFVSSDLRDLCPKCLIDLRPTKQALGLVITNPKASYEQLLQKISPQAATKRTIAQSQPSKLKNIFSSLIELVKPTSGSTDLKTESARFKEELKTQAVPSASGIKEATAVDHLEKTGTPAESAPKIETTSIQPAAVATTLSRQSVTDTPPPSPQIIDLSGADSDLNSILDKMLCHEDVQIESIEAQSVLDKPKPTNDSFSFELSEIEPQVTDAENVTADPDFRHDTDSIDQVNSDPEFDLEFVSNDLEPTTSRAESEQHNESVAAEEVPAQEPVEIQARVEAEEVEPTQSAQVFAPVVEIDTSATESDPTQHRSSLEKVVKSSSRVEDVVPSDRYLNKIESIRSAQPAQVSEQVLESDTSEIESEPEQPAAASKQFVKVEAPNYHFLDSTTAEQLFSRAALELKELPPELTFSSEQFISNEQRDEISVLFELAKKSIVDPEYLKQYEHEAVPSAERKIEVAPGVIKQLEKLERSLSAPVMSLKQGLLKGKGRAQDVTVEQQKAFDYNTVRPFISVRLKAFGIDLLIVSAIGVILSDLSFSALLDSINDGLNTTFIAHGVELGRILAYIVFLSVFYPLCCFSVFNATIGQRLLGLKLARTNGSEPKVDHLMLRALSFPLSVAAMGFLRLFWGKIALHDSVSRTVLCMTQDSEQPSKSAPIAQPS